MGNLGRDFVDVPCRVLRITYPFLLLKQRAPGMLAVHSILHSDIFVCSLFHP